MSKIKKDLIEMLNVALGLEHNALIQHLSYIEDIKDSGEEEVVDCLKEITSDEQRHKGKFKNLIDECLNGISVAYPVIDHNMQEINEGFETDLKNEKDVVNFYKEIYKKIKENKDELKYDYEILEDEIRHIIIDKQEHITDLLLLGVVYSKMLRAKELVKL